MEDKEKNEMFLSLVMKKRKLLELREVVKFKLNTPSNPLNNLQEQDVPCPDALFPNDLPSISPPPFSPLTPLMHITQQKTNKSQSEPNYDSESDVSCVSLRTSTLLRNLENNDPLSSPLPPMSPKTQELYDVLTKHELEAKNSLCDFQYHDYNSDGDKSPSLMTESLNRDACCDSETDCELNEEVITSTPRPHINQKETPNINTNNDDDTSAVAETVDETSTKTAEIEENQRKNTKKNKKSRSRKERQECKILRNSGKSYVTEKGKVVPGREIKDLRNCRLKCAERISEAERKQCFDDYWKLGNRDRRAAYISKSVTILPKKTQKTDSVTMSRDCYCIYKIRISDEDKAVCKECFCRILGETKGFINVTINKKKHSSTGLIDPDLRGSKPPKTKKSIEELSIARNHICSFPSYESHYCRKSTGKKYLPADLSISKMYREYQNSVENPVSLKLYSRCFRELNLSFKQPSKDTCNTCDVLNAKIKVANGDRKIELATELTEHQALAEKAYSEKRIDKDTVKDNTAVRAFTFDLQQCLPTPYLKTSVSFYKRQLWSFNLTIHDLSSNEATCYLWDETIGARGANQIASCLWHFCNALPPEVKEVIFYSDTCGGQNKNNIVAMMFMYLIKKHPTLQKISHKFLISGHTHMECDSDHAIIEKTKKNTQMKISHLYDWVQLIRSCKVKKPFKVVVMTLEDFLDFSSLKTKKGPYSLKKLDDTGKKFLWQPIKWLQYSKTHLGKMEFKDNLDRNSSFQSVTFNKRGKSTIENFDLNQISKEPLPISAEKKKDLMDLLDLIEETFRDFYINLKTTDCQSTDPDLDEHDPDLEES